MYTSYARMHLSSVLVESNIKWWKYAQYFSLSLSPSYGHVKRQLGHYIIMVLFCRGLKNLTYVVNASPTPKILTF